MMPVSEIYTLSVFFKSTGYTPRAHGLLYARTQVGERVVVNVNPKWRAAGLTEVQAAGADPTCAQGDPRPDSHTKAGGRGAHVHTRARAPLRPAARGAKPGLHVLRPGGALPQLARAASPLYPTQVHAV